MIALYSFLISGLSVYTIFIVACAYAWKKKSTEKKLVSAPSSIFFSIIIPFRNDVETLPDLLSSIEKQTYSKTNYEILLVDDNSEKITETLQPYLAINSNVKLLRLCEAGVMGKKQAINLGIQHAKGEYVITFDADVTIPSCNYLEELNKLLYSNPLGLLIGPVLIQGKKLVGLFQYLESFAILGVTGATARMNFPVSCNGANLIFKRDAVKSHYLNMTRSEIASGDDIFLLESIKEQGHKNILFSTNGELLAYAKAERKLKSFLYQRVRWSSKIKYYKFGGTLYAGLLLLFGNFSFVGILALAVMYNNLSIIFVALGLKIIPDLALTSTVAKNYNKKRRLIASAFISAIYFAYLFAVGLTSALRPHFTWKGRKIQK